MYLKDHYKILELELSATLPEIKKAYRRLALQYHPDKTQDDPYAAAHFIDVKGDTVFLKKLSGSSPCGSEEASYIYSIKDDVLFLKLVNDPCEIRSGAFSPEGYKRSKD